MSVNTDREPVSVPGLRSTRQRAAVSALLESIEEFKSAQDLHALLRAEGTAVGLTTVYRSLAALADAGEVDTIVNADGEALYRRCGQGAHHHHLVCRDCGRTVEIAGRAVEAWAAKVGSEHGYTDVSHTVEVFGRCAHCSR